MRKPTICIGENIGADQLLSNCFRYRDSTIPLLSKSKISSLYPSSVTVQAGLCRTWSELKTFVFSHTGSVNLGEQGGLVVEHQTLNPEGVGLTPHHWDCQIVSEQSK